MKLILCALFSAYLLAFPSRALNAAREAMALWANAVAPALFPFMALLPALSGNQARSAYARLGGGAMKTLFRLPAGAASSVAVGWIAGSPAGAIAVSRAFRADALDSREALVAGLLASGCGPVFVVSAVGAAMFGDASVGVRLLLSMWTALFLTAFLISRLSSARKTHSNAAKRGSGTRLPDETDAPRNKRDSALEDGEQSDLAPSPVRDAVLGTATICGWMILLRVIADALPAQVLPFTEVSLGCSIAAKAENGLLAAFLCGFGGVCAMCQNLSVLSRCGVGTLDFALCKIASGALCTVIYGVTERLFKVRFLCPADPLKISAIVGACALIPVFAAVRRAK